MKIPNRPLAELTPEHGYVLGSGPRGMPVRLLKRTDGQVITVMFSPEDGQCYMHPVTWDAKWCEDDSVKSAR